MDLLLIIKPIISVLTALLLLTLIFCVIYITKVIYKISRIVDRVEMLTDIKSWLDITKFLRRKNKKKE